MRGLAELSSAFNTGIALECLRYYLDDMIAFNPHARIDAENRERDRRLAALIRQNPEAIELGRSNLRDWAAHWGKSNPAWEEWAQLLRMLTPAQLADFLESSTPKANRLRQSSPFLGVLEDEDSNTRGEAAPYAA